MTPLPNDTDAIDFGASRDESFSLGLEEWRMATAAVLILVMIGVLVTLGHGKKTPG